jgi:hypothetical protein
MRGTDIIFDPIHGSVVPDGRIVAYIKNHSGRQMTIASETMLVELRAQHKEGKVRIDSLTFNSPTGPILLEINSYGRINHWPKGFADLSDNALMRLLTVERE